MEAAAIRRSLSPWRPPPPLLAFAATAALVTAFARISLLTPFGASDAAVEEMRRLVPWMVAAVAVSHGAAAALAARARHPLVAVGVVVAASVGLSHVPHLAYPVLLPMVREAAPAFCAMAPEYCPPAGWTPLVGALVGLALAPVVVAAVRVRASDALDGPAAMLSATGAWTGALAAALQWHGYITGQALSLAFGASLACLLVAALDAAARLARLRALAAAGRVAVTESRDDDPPDLAAYTALPAGVPCDRVLRVDERRVAGPYRGMRHGDPIARVPADLAVARAALARAACARAALFAAVGGAAVAALAR